ncbi:MAG: GatB/YqeY domain-containing protein [Candidatus Omnitrophica bacterium]|nr:GatB/YqeY domain-containing protein [Candidatus Omnitrophota bacterium]MCM8800056.1 GatB/YqeY domain-containing protein [Candidatus Omnitrophota bacterium]
MLLEERILKDYNEALKKKDYIRVSTLRFLRAALANLAIEKRKDKLDDSEVVSVIRKQIKSHLESIEQFKRGNRPDLVEKETAELKILNSYLPEELSEEKLREIIKEAIISLGASSLKDMGKVMKLVLEKVKERADAKKVSDLVKESLSKNV